MTYISGFSVRVLLYSYAPEEPLFCFKRMVKMLPNHFNYQVAMYLFSIGVLDVDNKGNILRLMRKGNNKRSKYFPVKTHIIGCRNEHGYLVAHLSLQAKRYNVFLHRLVWIFNNGIIPNGLEINHKNGIRTDNRLENLEIVTHKENMRHAINVLGTFGACGEGCINSKLTEKEVLEIRKLHNGGSITMTKLGKMFNTHKNNIGSIIHRGTWKHI